MATGTNPRIYDIATETAGGSVNLTQLRNEIAAAALPPDLTLQQTSTYLGQLSIGWNRDLAGAGEISGLDAIVNAHTAIVSSFRFGIYTREAIEITDSDIYQPRFEKLAPAIGEGRYLIQWQFELAASAPAECQARVHIDADVVGNYVTANNDFSGLAGFAVIDAVEGKRLNLKIEFRRLGGAPGDDVAIRRMIIAGEYKTSSPDPSTPV